MVLAVVHVVPERSTEVPTSTTSLSATLPFGLLDQEVEPFEDVGEPWNVRRVVVAVGVEAVREVALSPAL